MKKKIILLLVIIMIIAFPLTALAADSYDYNIEWLGYDTVYVTPAVMKSMTVDTAYSKLITNTSTHQIFFRVAYLSTWTYMTYTLWQSSGTTRWPSYMSDYYKELTGNCKMCMRRDSRDTYSGTRHVVGEWGPNGS